MAILKKEQFSKKPSDPDTGFGNAELTAFYN